MAGQCSAIGFLHLAGAKSPFNSCAFEFDRYALYIQSICVIIVLSFEFSLYD